MVHQAKDLSPAQRAAAELLLGRPLEDRETLTVQAFDSAPVSEERRQEISAGLRKLFADVDRSLEVAAPENAEDAFEEAMRSSRPDYRSHR